MTRRDWLAVTASGIAAAQPPSGGSKMIKPKALVQGDTIGLITPSTFVSDPERLETAERTVRYFGLIPKWGKNVGKKYGYAGGTVDERLEDLHAMFADSTVKAV